MFPVPAGCTADTERDRTGNAHGRSGRDHGAEWFWQIYAHPPIDGQSTANAGEGIHPLQAETRILRAAFDRGAPRTRSNRSYTDRIRFHGQGDQYFTWRGRDPWFAVVTGSAGQDSLRRAHCTIIGRPTGTFCKSEKRSAAVDNVQVRLAIAKVIWNAPHLLVLDEITTHLDFHTVTALATALSSFNGAILLVSHDRFLVRSVIEGKRDDDHSLDEEFEGVDQEVEEQSRRRSVYVMKGGKLIEQPNGVEQFEQSLVKRVKKMLSQ